MTARIQLGEMDIDAQNRAKRRMESVLRHLSNNKIGQHKHDVPIDTKSCAFKSSCSGAADVAGDIEDIFLSRKHSAYTGDDIGALGFIGQRNECLFLCIYVYN